MKTLVFVVPVHGRRQLASICLRQLRRTCDQLQAEGVHASAIVVTSGSEWKRLQKLTGDLKFGWVCRDNTFLGRKFNDAIQLATDPRFNPHPADYIVPFGSDDWADHRIFLNPPPADTIVGFQRLSIVREDGCEMKTVRVNYLGGAGIRIIPRQLVQELGYRPADDDRKKACDMSILRNIRAYNKCEVKVEHRHLHNRQIVDWKNPHTQINPYDRFARGRVRELVEEPFEALAGIYPDESLEAMRAFYGVREPVAA